MYVQCTRFVRSFGQRAAGRAPALSPRRARPSDEPLAQPDSGVGRRRCRRAGARRHRRLRVATPHRRTLLQHRGLRKGRGSLAGRGAGVTGPPSPRRPTRASFSSASWPATPHTLSGARAPAPHPNPPPPYPHSETSRNVPMPSGKIEPRKHNL